MLYLSPLEDPEEMEFDNEQDYILPMRYSIFIIIKREQDEYKGF